MLLSVNIGVLLSEKLLPTLGLGLVFTERSEEKRRPPHTYIHKQDQPQMLTQSHILTHTHTHLQENVDEVAEREGVVASCSQ